MATQKITDTKHETVPVIAVNEKQRILTEREQSNPITKEEFFNLRITNGAYLSYEGSRDNMIKELIFLLDKPISMEYAFQFENLPYYTNPYNYEDNLEELDLSNVDLSECTSLMGLCAGRTKLKTLKLPEISNKIRYYMYMLKDCSSLTGDLDMSNWNMSDEPINFAGAFSGSGFTRIIFPNKDVYSDQLGDIVANNPNLEYVDMSKVHGYKTLMEGTEDQYMKCQFGGFAANCPKLKHLDIRSIDADEIDDMIFGIFDNTNPDCLVIVKDEAMKEKIITNMQNSGSPTTLTNIKTVAEYGTN